MIAQPTPTAAQRADLARDFAHRYPLRSPRSQAHPSAVEREWRASPRPQAARRPRAKPSRLARIRAAFERLNSALWRLHDGMPAVWAALAAIVFTASAALTLGMLAVAFGWKP